MADKQIEFKTKLINEGKVYLKVSDAAKALGYSRQQNFINEHLKLIVKISGIQCINETDYNQLLSANKTALSKQGQIEITRIETLRGKLNSVMDFQTSKMLFARDYLRMMAARMGCKLSGEECILTHDIPKEKQKALQELIQQNENRNGAYRDMVEYLHDKERFDIDKIKSFGLDIQYLTSIDGTGKINLDVFIVGKGIFCRVSDFGDYQLWTDMYADENSDVILPYCNSDVKPAEEKLINLSHVEINRDFSRYHAIENMLWCIQNLKVDVLEDYEYEIFGMSEDLICFSMPSELLVKLIKPESIRTIYIDQMIDLETGQYITEFDSEKVFKEDFNIS